MNHRAAQNTVNAMRDAGLLDSSDEALCDAVIGLAAAVDAEPGNASLWREYRGALNDLRSLTDGGSSFETAMAGLFAKAGDSSYGGPVKSSR